MLAVQVHEASVNLLIVIIYQPGCYAVNLIFFIEFADVVKYLTVLAAPIIIVGDVNNILVYVIKCSNLLQSINQVNL